MIKDHVDLMIEFALHKVELDGLEMLSGLYLPIHMTVRQLPVYCEFNNEGAIFGMANLKTIVTFPIEEKELQLAISKLIQRAIKNIDS